MTADGGDTRRSYRSTVREQQARLTRRRILDAARAAFVARGYAGTTVRGIAAGAGVSVPTVELLFGTKAAVLKAAIDVAIVGDDEPVPVLDRAWTVVARGTPGAGGDPSRRARGQTARARGRAAPPPGGRRDARARRRTMDARF